MEKDEHLTEPAKVILALIKNGVTIEEWFAPMKDQSPDYICPDFNLRKDDLYLLWIECQIEHGFEELELFHQELDKLEANLSEE